MRLGEFTELLDLMRPSLKIMTISPSAEAKCDYERLKALLNCGVTPGMRNKVCLPFLTYT